MSPVTITNDAEPEHYGAVSPLPCDETTNLIKKQADEATTMAKAAKRTCLLSTSMIIGAAVLFVLGSAFSSSNSKQLQGKLPVLGYYPEGLIKEVLGYYGEGFLKEEITKEELGSFCNFESTDISAADIASQPCARCYILASMAMQDEWTPDGNVDFAMCYWNQIKASGRKPTSADFTLKPYDTNENTCDGQKVDAYENWFTNNGYFTSIVWQPPMPVCHGDECRTEDGWGYYLNYLLNEYYMLFASHCSCNEDWGYLEQCERTDDPWH